MCGSLVTSLDGLRSVGESLRALTHLKWLSLPDEFDKPVSNSGALVSTLGAPPTFRLESLGLPGNGTAGQAKELFDWLVSHSHSTLHDLILSYETEGNTTTDTIAHHIFEFPSLEFLELTVKHVRAAGVEEDDDQGEDTSLLEHDDALVLTASHPNLTMCRLVCWVGDLYERLFIGFCFGPCDRKRKLYINAQTDELKRQVMTLLAPRLAGKFEIDLCQ